MSCPHSGRLLPHLCAKKGEGRTVRQSSLAPTSAPGLGLSLCVGSPPPLRWRFHFSTCGIAGGRSRPPPHISPTSLVSWLGLCSNESSSRRPSHLVAGSKPPPAIPSPRSLAPGRIRSALASTDLSASRAAQLIDHSPFFRAAGRRGGGQGGPTSPSAPVLCSLVPLPEVASSVPLLPLRRPPLSPARRATGKSAGRARSAPSFSSTSSVP